MAQSQVQSQAQSPQTQPPQASQPTPAKQQQPQQQFEGKLVKKMRDATIGDAFFMEGSDQVVVSLDDGTERTVRRKELTELPK
jgi:hypothetical protein